MCGAWCTAQGLGLLQGLGVQGLGFMVQASGFRVSGFGFRSAKDSHSKAPAPELGFRV